MCIRDRYKHRTITKEDIIASINYLLNLMDGFGNTDDIDHLGNRRVRSVGELLQNQFRIGLSRMERVVKERMTIQDVDVITPRALINIRPVVAAIKEFFGSSQLSQFMDQHNPLSELTHKRRLSCLLYTSNSVISAVTMEAHKQGIEVLGMYDGFSHLAQGKKNYVVLNYDMVSRIHLNGGCILHMSRYNPTKNEDDLARVVDTLLELGVTYMVTIGGDDTAFSASKVSEYARKCGKVINSVHVPKTIDNDLQMCIRDRSNTV